MQLQDIEVGRIAPNDYNFNQMGKGELKDLTATVKAQGFVIHPIIVRPATAEGTFIIVDGEHQWRAATAAGLKTVPCQVLTVDGPAAIAETYRRNGLRGKENRLKLARAIIRAQKELVDAGRPDEASNVRIAKTFGQRSEGWIRKVLPYAELADLIANPRADIKGFPTTDDEVAGLSYEQVGQFLALASVPAPSPLPLEGGEGQAPASEDVPDPERVAAEKAEKAEAKIIMALRAMSPEARVRVQRTLTKLLKDDREKAAASGEGA